ncbi:MAG: hypothetical protein HY459_04080 [Parcubacteria group bacterium]|nr:hypothetical protein [Parcubacteria group bacterium]
MNWLNRLAALAGRLSTHILPILGIGAGVALAVIVGRAIFFGGEPATVSAPTAPGTQTQPSGTPPPFSPGPQQRTLTVLDNEAVRNLVIQGIGIRCNSMARDNPLLVARMFTEEDTGLLLTDDLLTNIVTFLVSRLGRGVNDPPLLTREEARAYCFAEMIRVMADPNRQASLGTFEEFGIRFFEAGPNERFPTDLSTLLRDYLLPPMPEPPTPRSVFEQRGVVLPASPSSEAGEMAGR